MDSLTHSASVVVRTSPEALYALVSDVTRTGEWSPVCRECEWDEGASGQVGDRFTGRNDNGTRQWEPGARWSRPSPAASSPGWSASAGCGGATRSTPWTAAPS